MAIIKDLRHNIIYLHILVIIIVYINVVNRFIHRLSIARYIKNI
jgi:hypothetical protein